MSAHVGVLEGLAKGVWCMCDIDSVFAGRKNERTNKIFRLCVMLTRRKNALHNVNTMSFSVKCRLSYLVVSY